MRPNDLPPWAALYQQARRWLAIGVFEALASDRRVLSGLAASSTVPDGHPLRLGHNGAKRKRGPTLHRAVGALEHLLTLPIVSTKAEDCRQIGYLAQAEQSETGERIHLAYVLGGCSGERAAGSHGMACEVAKLPKARKGIVLLAHRRVIGRSITRATRVLDLAKDDERYARTLAHHHRVALVGHMLEQGALLATGTEHRPPGQLRAVSRRRHWDGDDVTSTAAVVQFQPTLRIRERQSPVHSCIKGTFQSTRMIPRLHYRQTAA